MAEAEIALEASELTSSPEGFRRALAHVVEFEERIQALQGLAFTCAATEDLTGALAAFREASALFSAAGAWSRVAEANLAAAGLEASLQQTREATRRYRETLALNEQHELSAYAPLLELGLSRVHVSRGRTRGAIEAGVRACVGFARSGNALAYVSSMSFLSDLHRADGDLAEAYRILVTGAAIGRRLGLVFASGVFTGRIHQLKEQMGEMKFDAMVEQLLAEARRTP